jgi:hypothetical protein
MDFGYVPYASGDTCTWLTKLQIVASRHSLADIEIMLVTLIDRSLPAFLCSRSIKAIRVFEHKRNARHRTRSHARENAKLAKLVVAYAPAARFYKPRSDQ